MTFQVTIPKPYLIGGSSTIVIIYYLILPFILSSIYILLWRIQYSKSFGNIICVSELLFSSSEHREINFMELLRTGGRDITSYSNFSLLHL